MFGKATYIGVCVCCEEEGEGEAAAVEDESVDGGG